MVVEGGERKRNNTSYREFNAESLPANKVLRQVLADSSSVKERSPSDEDVHQQTSHSSSFSFLHSVNNDDCVESWQPRNDRLLKVHALLIKYVFFLARKALFLDEMTFAIKV